MTPAAAISSILFQQACVYRHQHPSREPLASTHRPIKILRFLRFDLIYPEPGELRSKLKKMILHLKNSGYDMFQTENYARPFGATRFAVALAI